MKKLSTNIVVAVILSASVGARAEWYEKIKEDPITGQKMVIVTKTATSDDGYLKRKGKARIVFRCNKDYEVDMYIDFDDYLTGALDVTYRLDKEEAVTSVWSTDTSNTSAFAPNSLTLIQTMYTYKKFAVRATPYNETPRTLIFDITGLKKHTRVLRDVCGWKLEPLVDISKYKFSPPPETESKQKQKQNELTSNAGKIDPVAVQDARLADFPFLVEWMDRIDKLLPIRTACIKDLKKGLDGDSASCDAFKIESANIDGLSEQVRSEQKKQEKFHILYSDHANLMSDLRAANGEIQVNTDILNRIGKETNYDEEDEY